VHHKKIQNKTQKMPLVLGYVVNENTKDYNQSTKTSKMKAQKKNLIEKYKNHSTSLSL
jgi:hypothetical protein